MGGSSRGRRHNGVAALLAEVRGGWARVRELRPHGLDGIQRRLRHHPLGSGPGWGRRRAALYQAGTCSVVLVDVHVRAGKVNPSSRPAADLWRLRCDFGQMPPVDDGPVLSRRPCVGRRLVEERRRGGCCWRRCGATRLGVRSWLTSFAAWGAMCSCSSTRLLHIAGPRSAGPHVTQPPRRPLEV